jgi:hypothetical protein
VCGLICVDIVCIPFLVSPYPLFVCPFSLSDHLVGYVGVSIKVMLGFVIAFVVRTVSGAVSYDRLIKSGPVYHQHVLPSSNLSPPLPPPEAHSCPRLCIDIDDDIIDDDI